MPSGTVAQIKHRSVAVPRAMVCSTGAIVVLRVNHSINSVPIRVKALQVDKSSEWSAISAIPEGQPCETASSTTGANSVGLCRPALGISDRLESVNHQVIDGTNRFEKARSRATTALRVRWTPRYDTATNTKAVRAAW